MELGGRDKLGRRGEIVSQMKNCGQENVQVSDQWNIKIGASG